MAAETERAATSIEVQLTGRYFVGDRFEVAARLLTASGEPVADATLTLVTSDVTKRARTDELGNTLLTVPGELIVGLHQGTILYTGSAAKLLAPTDAAFEFLIDPMIATTLTIDPIGVPFVGDRFEVVASLQSADGQPVIDTTLTLATGDVERQARTDELGVAVFRISGDLFPVGTRELRVSYGGSKLKHLDVTDASVAIEIAPLVTTIVIIEPVVPQRVGDDFEVEIRLRASTGAPVGEATVTLTAGEFERRARTNRFGTAIFSVPGELPTGTHALTVSYAGSKADHLTGGTGTTDVAIHAMTLTIETVPPTAGIAFYLDGIEFLSGSDGFATLAVAEPGTHQLQASPEVALSDVLRAKFRRWGDPLLVPSREIEMQTDMTMQAGYGIEKPIALEFIDLAGAPVPSSDIERMIVRNTIGERLVVTELSERLWVRENNIANSRLGLLSPVVTYTVESLDMQGSNVVNKNQQRYTSAQDEWVVQILLYDLAISARDRIFGFPIGEAIDLIYPSGLVERYELDDNGDVTIRSLPRGSYQVTVIAPGLPVTQPLTLTRPQDVRLAVLSYVDAGVALAVLVVATIGPLIIGRKLVRRIRGG